MENKDNLNNELQDTPCVSSEHDECISEGICSVNPTLSSIHEVISLYLRELSFYLLKLKDFGITNDMIKETIIYVLFNIVTNAEYSQKDFHRLIVQLYDYITQSKAIYEKFCLENNIEIETTKSYFKYSKKFDLNNAIRKGEKYFLKKSSSFTTKQKNLYDIMFFLGKSITIKLVELQKLGKENYKAYYAVLSLLNIINLSEFSDEQVREKISNVVEAYYSLVKEIYETQIERYGATVPVDVSFSTTPGKAILVSGSDYQKLENVLKATEGIDISVYTHGIELLMAHSFPKFRSHPNLKGHFGTSADSSMIDFATFPGSVLMTKGTLQRVEYLYRGRLFTLDPIPPLGVVCLKENNYEPLIKAALDAKGFEHGQEKPSVRVGFSEKEIIKKVDEILDKMKNKKIKYLYLVGLINLPHSHKAYFEKFFELLPKDCYAISLCCPTNNENVYHPDSFYDYSFVYNFLKEIEKKIPLNEIEMSVFLTKCDKHTISNLLYLKQVGIKNVFMCNCPPSLINPALLKTLQETFDIKEFFNPVEDIASTLNDSKA